MSVPDHGPPVPSPRRPRRIHLRGRLLRLVILLPAIVLGASFLPLHGDSPPRSVPADVCALIPADLLSRVVPAGKVSEVDARNAEPYRNVARCTVRTDSDSATTTAYGSLNVELQRHGSLGRQGPGDRARDDFASSKKFALTDTISPQRVFDVNRLGDSAFVAIGKPNDFAVQEHQSAVEVQVLADERTLLIYYVASPTTDDLAVSAAVAVARALLGQT
jgi:hypothetical protein